MAFSKGFSESVCVGDSIETEVDGFQISACVVLDDCCDTPDQRSDGFWPSLDIGAPGFIGPGPKHRQRFEKALAEAQAVMDAWREGEWFYCGIVLSVARDGVVLESHVASLWGVEANYPGTDNAYLTAVADELLPDAVEVGREKLMKLCGASSG